jgi:hypothetical protein
MAVYRVLTWTEYRELALALKPAIVYYSRDPHPTCQPPWGLKLIFYHGFDGYVFTDYAQGAALHKTGIPIRGQDPRDIPLLVEDVEQFLHNQIGTVKVSPIWFPG